MRTGVRTYDVLVVGAGPFGLGMAALASSVPGLDVVVLEASDGPAWHPGLLFDDASLQVSFLADLVSLVDPTHPLSFLAYLREHDRLYQFYVRERFHPSRREYADYLAWAAARLPSVHFGRRVTRMVWDADAAQFEVSTPGNTYRAHNVVLGVGTEPHIPDALAGLPPGRLLHSADYLHRLADIEAAGEVTVVGSGQSGAEVVLDLLRRGRSLSWLTRTASFAPLDYSKLVLEMTTPDYVRYFHQLAPERRDELVAAQWQHYKGIDTDTIDALHELLYQRELADTPAPVELRCGVAVESTRLVDDRVLLCCRHVDTDTRFSRLTDLVVAATGYVSREPAFLSPLASLVRRDCLGRFRVRADHSIELAEAVTGRLFVLNADLHSHGAAAPDLGFGAVRNATVLNSVLGREVFRLPRRTAFTSFAIPPG